MDIKYVEKILKPLKVNELAGAMNLVHPGVSWSGLKKSDLICDIVDNTFNIHDRITRGRRSFEAWASYVIENAINRRKEKAKARNDLDKKHSSNERDLVMKLLDRLENGEKLTGAELSIFCRLVKEAVWYHYSRFI